MRVAAAAIVAGVASCHATLPPSPKRPTNCVNCGAGLERFRFECSYCRTIYPASYGAGLDALHHLGPAGALDVLLSDYGRSMEVRLP